MDPNDASRFVVSSARSGRPLTMKLSERIVDLSIRYPRTVVAAVIVLVLGLGSQIPRIVIDTDPENMLSPEQPARVFHSEVKRDFNLHDIIVVGVVNEEDPDGVFNPETLANLHRLTQDIEQIEGVIRPDLLSLSTVDNISQGGPGVVRFDWLMREPPETREEALAIRAAAERLPMFQGTLLSEDGRAVTLYVPIVEKSQSHRIATEIRGFVADLNGTEEYFITGLPVAEDTFGVEMFLQMGVAAPLAGLIIFFLMWFFFRSVTLVLSPMILAIVTVISTMGLLIGLGFTVHIMSSMIPIFLMPIAVVDSVHILSEFADHYVTMKDRRETIRMVMRNLFTPMLYTSLTSVAGFASLVSAPIPPVQVFGSFVAFGIALAFLLTITFIPAFVTLMSDGSIQKLRVEREVHERHWMARWLTRLGPRTLSHAKAILVAAAIVLVVSIVGITRIQINDNPVRWFRSHHPIRIADQVLNAHFGGTYDAFLVLRYDDQGEEHSLVETIGSSLASAGRIDLSQEWDLLHRSTIDAPPDSHLDLLIDAVLTKLDEAEDEEAPYWEDVLDLLDQAQIEGKFFQRPETLHFIEGLESDLIQSGLVGKVNSVADIVKTVHRDLREGNPSYYTIPDTPGGVAQTLLSYESSHRPQDLWHFITSDYRAANLWLQMKSGDNRDMTRVTSRVAQYLQSHPLPEGVSLDWAGLTYLNVVWQHNMVYGMLRSLLGSFAIVFVMMLVLFRSFWFAVLAMLPLSLTISFIYGLIGLVGKDYDMPVAVLSSLTLGLSVDFAIHFLERARAIHKETGDWEKTMERMFREPARAITRNAIVIAVGFLPLLLSPLVPYNTVGIFLCAIMAISCLVTIVLLPGVMSPFQKRLFAETRTVQEKRST
jgi:predicted RND superfamily exporter protein